MHLSIKLKGKLNYHQSIVTYYYLMINVNFFYGAIQLAITEFKNVKLIGYFTNQI